MPGTRTSFEDHDCGFAQTVEALGDQWSMLILRNLFMGMTRFEDFAAHLSISSKVLADRLQRLESKGLIGARIDEHDARGKIYELTEKGRGLGLVVVAMTDWGETWEPKPQGVRTEIYELATNKPIAGLAVVSNSGKTLGAEDVGSRTGPGGSMVRDHLDELVEKRKAS